MEYDDIRSMVMAVAGEMIEFDTEKDIPFVYKLKHKVFKNLYPNLIRNVNRPKRLLTYSNNIRSIEQMLENGEDTPDRIAHLYYEAILERFDNEEANKQLLQTKTFTEQEKAILLLWKNEPTISTRKLSTSLNISQSTASRAERKLKEKLAG